MAAIGRLDRLRMPDQPLINYLLVNTAIDTRSSVKAQVDVVSVEADDAKAGGPVEAVLGDSDRVLFGHFSGSFRTNSGSYHFFRR